MSKPSATVSNADIHAPKISYRPTSDPRITIIKHQCLYLSVFASEDFSYK